MNRRLVAAIGAAATLTLAVALPASAAPTSETGAESSVQLNPGNVGATVTGAGGCTSGNLLYDAWHFVAPGAKTGFTSLTVAFDSNGDQTADQWYSMGPGEFGPPSDKHAYLLTSQHLTLVGASATVTGQTTGFIVLSGTCPAAAGNE